MKISSIPDATTIAVKRGWDSTVAASHLENTYINVLSAADDALVEPDDDFGFNGVITDSFDGLTYSPTQQTDV